MATQYDYDSAAVRAAAMKVKQCNEQLRGETSPKLRQIAGEIPGHFAGEAATALDERVAEMSADAAEVCESFDKVYRALMAYAAELERTGQELARQM